MNEKIKAEKAVVFIDHIRKHLFDDDIYPRDVVCKICGKTFDEIWELETNKENHVFLPSGVYKEGTIYIDRNGKQFKVSKI